MDVYEKSLRLHAEKRGKFEVRSLIEVKDKESLSLAYTPGVAQPCREIAKDPSAAYLYTRKWNTVAVVSDGSAVLGLGNIGGLAGLPVMEGKSILFREFAGIDSVPIVLSGQEEDEIVKADKPGTAIGLAWTSMGGDVLLIEAEAIAYAVEAVSPSEIDRINILNASIAGMQRAVMNLSVRPEYLLIDGNRFRPFSFISALENSPVEESAAAYDSIPYSCIVKGDGKFAPIAAASVLAKTYRDEYMMMIAKEYPEYGWERNMGYPTREHIEAVRRFGLTPYHRRSFHLKELEPALF